MKIKKNNVYGIFIIAILLASASIFYLKDKPKQEKAKEGQQTAGQESWNVDGNGYLSYPLERPKVKFNRQDYGQINDTFVSKVIYQSTNGNIYGLLAQPKDSDKLLPGVVLLPGAGVSKESELGLAVKIAELGAAVLVIDQRGVGETNGPFPALDKDYNSFLAGVEPNQHIMIYDALRGYDLLKDSPFTDSDNIIIAGESLGGRIAVIAAAIDRNIKGVLVISSSGFGFKKGNDPDKDRFIKSIDSDHYIGLITPRKIVFMHNIQDSNIPVSAAVNSFNKAQEPKEIFLVNDTSCNHGYCDSMYESLVGALDYLVDIKSKTIASVDVAKN